MHAKVDELTARRQRTMRALALCPRAELDALWQAFERALGGIPAHEVLRQPEKGLVMVQGRAGGSGNAFNLGEMTVTRAAVRLDSGATGIGYAQGRDRERARMAALADALVQTTAHAARVERDLVAPIEALKAEADRQQAERTAATRVEFFTMVRGS